MRGKTLLEKSSACKGSVSKKFYPSGDVYMNINTSTTNGMPAVPPLWEQTPATYVENSMENPQPQEDTVRVSGSVNGNLQEARLLDDEEAEVVFEETISMLGGDRNEALNVHSGLDAARVAALLAF